MSIAVRGWVARGCAVMAVCFAIVAQAAPIQLPLFHTGAVNVAARDSQGRTVIGGYFTYINGVASPNLRRLSATGTLDPNWKATVNGSILGLACDASDDAAFIVGDFIDVNGTPRDRVARIGADGALSAWTASPPAGQSSMPGISALARLSDGDLLAITTTDTVGVLRLMRIDRDTGASALVAGEFSGTINAMLVTAAGHVLVGGNFAYSDGAIARNFLVQLQAGTLATDTNFAYAPAATVTALAQWPGDGRLIVAGGGLLRRVMADGVIDPTWSVTYNRTVTALHARADGSVYLGGTFGSVANTARNRLARVDVTGALDAAWNAGPLLGDIRGMVPGGDAVQIFGGLVAPESNQVGFVALSPTNAAGPTEALTLRTGVAPSVGGSVFEAVALPDGGVVMWGLFSHAADTVLPGLLRFNANGTLRRDWRPIVNGTLQAMHASPDGDLYFAGVINADGAPAVNGTVVRVAANAARPDATWRLTANSGFVNSLSTQGNHVIAAGNMSGFNGQASSTLARATRAGTATVDADWTPAADGEHSFARVLGRDDGSVIYWPYFSGSVEINPPPPPGVPQNVLHLVTTQNDGSELTSNFGPPFDSTLGAIHTVFADAQQRLYVAGPFRTSTTPQRLSLIRLLPNGSIDASFPVDLGGRAFGAATALGGDGNVYALTVTYPGNVATPGITRIDTQANAIDIDWQSSSPLIADADLLVAQGPTVFIASRDLDLIGGVPTLRGEFLTTAATAWFGDGFE